MNNLLNLTKCDMEIHPLTLAYTVNKAGVWSWTEDHRENCALVLVEKGSFIYHLDNQMIRLGQGELMLLKAGDRYIARSNIDERNPDCIYHIIAFDISEGEFLFQARKYTVRHFEKLLELFQEMILCMDELKFGYVIKGKKILYDIFYHIYKEMYYSEILSPTQLNIENARRYVDSNYSKKITIEQLAALSGYSLSHFKKLFRQQYSISPCEYITMVRINKAKILLESKTMSINEIAIRTGFNSGSYLCQIFKKKVGCVPSEY